MVYAVSPRDIGDDMASSQTLGGLGPNSIQTPMPVSGTPIVDKSGSLTTFGHQMITAIWNRTGQGPGLNSADINNNTNDAITIAKAALPRAGGTMTGPLIGQDGGTWDGAGIGQLTSLGIGRNEPSAGSIDISGEYKINGNQIAAHNLSDGTTGTTKIVLADSPALTGVPVAPTATSGTNNTQIATTAFVQASGASNGANPTGTVGLSAVNGTATTFLRSDGAPALSQAITPTWSGQHLFMVNTGFGAAITPDSPLTVNSNSGTTVAPSAGTNLHIIGANAVSSRITIDAYGAACNIGGRSAEGTQLSPTLTTAFRNVLSIGASGYTGSGYVSAASVAFQAAANWSGTSAPIIIIFSTTAVSSTTPAAVMTIAKGLILDSSTANDPGLGIIRQKVYTVATLPTPVAAGCRSFISDATLGLSAGLGLAPIGGGGNTVPVYTDATPVWRIG